MSRQASVVRRTSETDITMSLDLDGTGQADVATGIGFLDHMLTAVAVHGIFDLTLQATGDLHIDPHHTIEDVGIVLGQAIMQALGDKAGIVRMGTAYVPMDETLARTVIDLSGRPYAVVRACFDTPAIGQMPTSLVGHMLESIALNGRFNLHAEVFYGNDDHHKAEALFKAFGRALGEAVRLDPRRSGVASTKGTLT